MEPERRRCGICNEGDLVITHETALRGGGSEETWVCGACGSSVKLLSPFARLMFAVLALFFVGAVPWTAVTDRVRDESERPWIMLLMAVLALAVIGLFVRDLGRQRRHPRVTR